MRDVSEHQRVVAALVAPAPSAPVYLDEAAGRVLDEDRIARIALPSFDNSAMDGYAVRAEDIAGASSATPVVLPVAHDIPAGQLGTPPLEPATAHRIMTGAPLPAGADTVVPVEATDGGTERVVITEERTLGSHVRYAGEDVQAGDTVLSRGAVLGPAQIGLLSALGVTILLARPTLRVLVLSTGSELVEQSRRLSPGQIYDANGPMLAAAATAAGAQAEQVRFVADEVAQFHDTLAEWLDEVDLIVTSGGVSAGAYEVVKDALATEDVEFVKVAMQPGMPQGAGRYQGVPIVTVPGNPVSALVSFEVFLRPALRAAMGFPDVTRRTVTARLSAALTSPAGRRQFRRGILDESAGTVQPAGPPGSHFLRSLAVANCLLDIPADVTSIDAGEEVTVWSLS